MTLEQKLEALCEVLILIQLAWNLNIYFTFVL